METQADEWFVQLIGHIFGAAGKGLRFFIETFGARDILFIVVVEERRRVGTGRIVGGLSWWMGVHGAVNGSDGSCAFKALV